MSDTSWWRRVLVAAAVAGTAALVVGSCGDDEEPATTGSATSTTVAVTTTRPVSTTTTRPASTTTTTGATTSEPSGRVPLRVLVVAAAPGGGSGEIEVHWDAVIGATGYRVARSSAPDGPFSVSADVDLLAGTADVASGVMNVYSDQQTFYPTATTPPAPPIASPHFHYVEVTGLPTYFRVTAYNAAGDAPASPTVCASPPPGSPC